MDCHIFAPGARRLAIGAAPSWVAAHAHALFLTQICNDVYFFSQSDEKERMFYRTNATWRPCLARPISSNQVCEPITAI